MAMVLIEPVTSEIPPYALGGPQTDGPLVGPRGGGGPGGAKTKPETKTSKGGAERNRPGP